MKTLFALVLLIPVLAFGQADIWFGAAASTPKAGGAAPSCALEYDMTVPTATTTAIGNSTARYYVGASNVLFSSSETICGVAIVMTNVTTAGDISAKQFQILVFTIDGINLGDQVGASASVYGTNSWALTEVYFPFTTKPVLTNGMAYNFVVTMNAVDAANYAGVFSGTPTANAARFCRWSNTKAYASGSSGAQSWLKIYTE